ncbi:hypothetical protein GCM10010446_14170 [Streptomyces enissocaesilis]|uniref:Transposase n=1 Tax=Streptomyces enissocaesilis TaxID=332589 RepID=A0ABN3WZC8_9ACTN
MQFLGASLADNAPVGTCDRGRLLQQYGLPDPRLSSEQSDRAAVTVPHGPDRTYGRLMLHRCLARDHETLPTRSEAVINIAMTDLMARRLTSENTISWRDPKTSTEQNRPSRDETSDESDLLGGGKETGSKGNSSNGRGITIELTRCSTSCPDAFPLPNSTSPWLSSETCAEGRSCRSDWLSKTQVRRVAAMGVGCRA